MNKIKKRLQNNMSNFRYNFESSCSSVKVVSNGHLSEVNMRIEQRIKQNEMERVGSKEIAGSYTVR